LQLPSVWRTPMPRSKEPFSNEEIDVKINKAFGLLGATRKKNIKIADILSYINFEEFIEKSLPEGYRTIEYTYNSWLKIDIFMDLKNIKKQTELIDYLKKHKREMKKLGLNRVPHQTSVSKFKNHYIPEELKELVQYTVEKIKTIANQFQIELDTNISVKKPKSKRNTSAKKYFIDTEARKSIKIISNMLKELKILKTSQNSIYSQDDYIDVLLKMMIEHSYPETATREMRLEKNTELELCDCGKSILYPLIDKEKKDWAMNYKVCPVCGRTKRICPDADSTIERIETTYDSIEKIMKKFEIFLEKIFHKTNIFHLLDKPVDIAIDRTDIPFYGDIDSTGIVGKKPEAGTEYGYALYTLYITMPGIRFNLFTLPLLNITKGIPESIFLNNQDKIVEQLLSCGKNKLEIQQVIMDKGFCDSSLLNMIEDKRLNYLTLPINNKKMVEKTENLPSHSYITDYEYGSCKYNLLVTHGFMRTRKKNQKKKKVIFRNATNERPQGDLHQWIDSLSKKYRKRWGIESSYRVSKEDLYPRTRSKKYIVRLFLFYLMVFFYNLWIILNILVSEKIYGELQKDPIVTAKDFLVYISICDPG
jgi:hypothetical protein